MNCADFRQQYNAWLDGRKEAGIPPEAAVHARTCPSCGAYARAMLRIDAGLGNLPPVSVPEEILDAASLRGSHAGALARAAAFAVPAVPALAAWVIAVSLPWPWNPAAQCALVAGAVMLFAVTSLRPKFVA